jgi:hypothetical protein
MGARPFPQVSCTAFAAPARGSAAHAPKLIPTPSLNPPRSTPPPPAPEPVFDVCGVGQCLIDVNVNVTREMLEELNVPHGGRRWGRDGMGGGRRGGRGTQGPS